MVLEILLGLGVGILVGLIFSACRLPLPAPPMLAGLMGIVGIYLGGQLWPVLAKLFS